MLNIKGNEAALGGYNDMKLGKKAAYIIFKIKNNEIDLEKTVLKADAGDDYLDDFVAAVKETGQPRFSVVDWNHKLVFVSWVPDTSKAQLKMKYASVKEGFIQELQGIAEKIQATDDSELSKDRIMELTKSKV